MAETSVEWTRRLRPDGTLMPGFSWNPWWGCSKVSPACKHCYAETFANRLGMDDLWTVNGPRRFFGDKHWNEPLFWDRKAAKAGETWLVFCASMADVGEVHPALDAPRLRLFRLIERTRNLVWLLLTKRPESFVEQVPWAPGAWPRNAWFGITVETPEYLGRIRSASSARAPVTFVSYEPAIEPVDFTPHLGTAPGQVSWLIMGTEQTTSRRARVAPLELAADVVAQCRATGARPFIKQLDAGLLRLGRKGEVVKDLAQLPTALRVREWPDILTAA